MSISWGSNFRNGWGDDSDEEGPVPSAYKQPSDDETRPDPPLIDEDHLSFTETPFTIAARLAASRKGRSVAGPAEKPISKSSRASISQQHSSVTSSSDQLAPHSTPPTSPFVDSAAALRSSPLGRPRLGRPGERPALKPARVALKPLRGQAASRQMALRFQVEEGTAEEPRPEDQHSDRPSAAEDLVEERLEQLIASEPVEAAAYEERPNGSFSPSSDENVFAFSVDSDRFDLAQHESDAQQDNVQNFPPSPPRKRPRLGINPRYKGAEDSGSSWSTLWASKLRGSAAPASGVPPGLRPGQLWSSSHHRSVASRKLRLSSVPGGQTAEERQKAVERSPHVQLFQPTPLAVEQRLQREAGRDGHDDDDDEIVWL